jgi:hypothetical protein
MNLASAGIGWWWPFENIVIVAPQPTKLSLINGRLHNSNAPVISYAGFDIYALNGVVFNDEMIRFITTPVDKLSPQDILAIKNVEQRAEVIKRVGIQKLFAHLDTKKLDHQNDYELHQIIINENWKPRKYLLMKNPSVDEIHLEAVHPDCNTVESALNFRNFGSTTGVFIQPIKLT